MLQFSPGRRSSTYFNVYSWGLQCLNWTQADCAAVRQVRAEAATLITTKYTAHSGRSPATNAAPPHSPHSSHLTVRRPQRKGAGC